MQWRLVSINGQAIQPSPPRLLRISNGKVGGFDGCNGFSADVSVKKNTVSASSPINSTQTGCPELLRAPSFTDLLRYGASYRILGQSLTLTGGGNIWTCKSIAVPVPTRPPVRGCISLSWGRKSAMAERIEGEWSVTIAPEGSQRGHPTCTRT